MRGLRPERVTGRWRARYTLTVRNTSNAAAGLILRRFGEEWVRPLAEKQSGHSEGLSRARNRSQIPRILQAGSDHQ